MFTSVLHLGREDHSLNFPRVMVTSSVVGALSAGICKEGNHLFPNYPRQLRSQLRQGPQKAAGELGRV